MSLRRMATAALILSLVLTLAHGMWAIQVGAQEGAAASSSSNATGGAVTPEYRGLGPGQPGWSDCPYWPDGLRDGTGPHWGWWDDDEDEDI